MSNTNLLGSYGAQDSSSLMFRNRIINGDMKVSQRYDNVAAHPITAGQIFYTIDRFFVFATGANVTGQRIAGTGANPYVYRITGAASNTQCLLIQRIEALNSEDLVNKTVTLQFEASAAVITSLDYDIRVPSARDNFGTTASVTSGTVTVSATPTVFTVTCTLPANAANGLQINLGKTSGLVASQTFSISGVQLEAGPTATPFERRPYSVELGMCQRYFQNSSRSGASRTIAFGTTGSGQAFFVVPTGVVMRSNASFAFVGTLSFRQGGTDNSITSIGENNVMGVNLHVLANLSTNVGNGIAGNLLLYGANNSYSISAEL